MRYTSIMSPVPSRPPIEAGQVYRGLRVRALYVVNETPEDEESEVSLSLLARQDEPDYSGPIAGVFRVDQPSLRRDYERIPPGSTISLVV